MDEMEENLEVMRPENHAGEAFAGLYQLSNQNVGFAWKTTRI